MADVLGANVEYINPNTNESPLSICSRAFLRVMSSYMRSP